jgi:CxxC motif-containing protein (DUF1111 family)
VRPGLSADDRRAFMVGNSLFRDNWIVAPARAEGRDGLGPLFHANSCSACHQEDGRGRPPASRTDVGLGMIVLVSPADADGMPHPVYGKQLQDQAVPSVQPEVSITPQEEVVHGALGDGISGRAHRVSASGHVGRFGWKASKATLQDQVLAALHEDIGITSDAHPDETLTAAQRALVHAPSGGSPEIDARKVQRLAHYCRSLAVPAQRDAGTPEVERGRLLFAQAGCVACHLPTLVTGESSPVPQLRGVTIHPDTDLLQHDMGAGLADDRRDGEASGREWRTPPLWGLGLVRTVNGHTRLLHDGRARDAVEVVLWHGGEGQRARDAFVSMRAEDRAVVCAFLDSL